MKHEYDIQYYCVHCGMSAEQIADTGKPCIQRPPPFDSVPMIERHPAQDMANEFGHVTVVQSGSESKVFAE